MLLSKHQPFLLFFYFQGIYLCLSCATEYEGKAEEGLVESRDVDLVDLSFTVSYKLKRKRFPGAGSALAVGGSGLAVGAEACHALDLAPLKSGIQQDLFAFALLNIDEGRAEPSVIVEIKV